MSIFEFNQEEYEKSVRDESREEGRKEGVQDINALNKWLFEQGRIEDVQKATTDEEFQKALFAEMELAQKG